MRFWKKNVFFGKKLVFVKKNRFLEKKIFLKNILKKNYFTSGALKSRRIKVQAPKSPGA